MIDSYRSERREGVAGKLADTFAVNTRTECVALTFGVTL